MDLYACWGRRGPGDPVLGPAGGTDLPGWGNSVRKKSGPLAPATLALLRALCVLLPLLTYVLATLLLLPLPCSIPLTLFDSGANCVDFVCTCPTDAFLVCFA